MERENEGLISNARGNGVFVKNISPSPKALDDGNKNATISSKPPPTNTISYYVWCVNFLINSLHFIPSFPSIPSGCCPGGEQVSRSFGPETTMAHARIRVESLKSPPEMPESRTPPVTKSYLDRGDAIIQEKIISESPQPIRK